MKKYSIVKNRTKSQRPKEWPVVVYLWTLGLGLLGYLIGEFFLSARPHPYHWLLLIVGVILGLIVGWLWYHWRGDIKI